MLEQLWCFTEQIAECGKHRNTWEVSLALQAASSVPPVKQTRSTALPPHTDAAHPSAPPSAPAPLPPVTWPPTRRARHVGLSRERARRPLPAHVRAHPAPRGGLAVAARSPPPPGAAPSAGPGAPRPRSPPGPPSSPEPGRRRHVPRAPAHLPRGAERRGPLREAPTPPSAPAAAQARVAAAAGSSAAAPRRFQVGPRLPLLPLPAAPAAPSGPLLSAARRDWRARSRHRLLVTGARAAPWGPALPPAPAPG